MLAGDGNSYGECLLVVGTGRLHQDARQEELGPFEIEAGYLDRLLEGGQVNSLAFLELDRPDPAVDVKSIFLNANLTFQLPLDSTRSYRSGDSTNGEVGNSCVTLGKHATVCCSRARGPTPRSKYEKG